jgi:hypothetical protein
VVAAAAQEAPLPEVLAVLEAVVAVAIHLAEQVRLEQPIPAAVVVAAVMTALFPTEMARTAAPVS